MQGEKLVDQNDQTNSPKNDTPEDKPRTEPEKNDYEFRSGEDCSIISIVEDLYKMSHKHHPTMTPHSYLKEQVSPTVEKLQDVELKGELKSLQETIKKLSALGAKIAATTAATGPLAIFYDTFKIMKAAYDIRKLIVEVKKLTDTVCKK